MTPPFRNTALPLDERLRDLLDRLTLEEKVGLLHQHQAPVPRLGLGAFRTGTEALHGLAWLGPATVFPQVIGLASAWDPDLLRRVGRATADEVLASHHRDPSGAGPNVWAPVVNPLRDPRWGRNEEGYSEDPWLTGLLASAHARGLAGEGPVLRTAPTLKHFLGYNNETDRCTTSSDLPPRVLHEYELPAYLPALREGSAVAVMPSYNLVNGRPAHLSPLIDSVLRQAAPDRIMVVSDAHAPGNLFGLQAFHPDPPTAYAHALRAGLDSFTQDDDRPEETLGHIRSALAAGLVEESDVDRAVRNILSVRLRLGEFDPGPRDRGAQDTPEHRALAREAATRSLTLLRNEGLLPLAAPQRIAVLGPLGDTLLEDWYSGTLPYAVTARAALARRAEVVFHDGADRIRLDTESGSVAVPADGGPAHLVPGGDPERAEGTGLDLIDWGGGAHSLRSPVTGLHVDEGPEGTLVCTAAGPGTWEVRQTFRLRAREDGLTDLIQLHTGRSVAVSEDGTLRLTDGVPTGFRVRGLGSGAEEAARTAASADVAVVVLGDHPMVNGRETQDREELDLPQGQERVLRAVHTANPDTVLVLSSGCPFAVTWAQENVPAILWSGHGGQEYGHALADVLFGDAEPAGRLTQTWYRSADDLPDLLDYDIIGSGGTYLYFEGTPLYPFGHGLGYTTLDYGDPEVTVAGEEVRVRVEVANTGDRVAEEVVQVYTRQRSSRVRQPVRALRGFSRLRIGPGRSETATVSFPTERLAVWDTTRDRFVVEAADREVLVGRSAADIRARAVLRVPGERIPHRDAFRTWAATGYDAAHRVRLCPTDPQEGEAVRAAQDGSWVAFRGIDFGAGASACRLTVNSPKGSALRLLLADPLQGEEIATVEVPASSDPYAFTEVAASLAGVAGVRDLYLCMPEAETAVAEIGFTRR